MRRLALIRKLFAHFDRTISRILRLSSSISTPGRNGAAREENYYGTLGFRFIIFRNGKVRALGGVLSVLHRYDKAGNLLSRQLRFKAEREPGDALFFGRAPHSEAVGMKVPAGGLWV